MKRKQYYEVQIQLLRLEQRIREVKEDLAQAKYDLRACDDKLLNYQAGVRRFLDQISGKREEKLETLRREVRMAESSLQSLRREMESLDHRQEELRNQLRQLPSSEAIRAEGEKEWAQWEAAYCAEALLPLLDDTGEALLEYRSLLQGSRMEILTVEHQQQITAEPHLKAEACSPWLRRLAEAKEILGEAFDPGSFLNSPAAFLVAAAKHNRLDKVNQAMDQVVALQKQLRKQ